MFTKDIYFEISKWIFNPRDIKSFSQTCKSLHSIVKIKLYKAKTLQGIRKEYYSSPYDSILKRHIFWYGDRKRINKRVFLNLTTKQISQLGESTFHLKGDKNCQYCMCYFNSFLNQLKWHSIPRPNKDYTCKKPKLHGYLRSDDKKYDDDRH